MTWNVAGEAVVTSGAASRRIRRLVVSALIVGLAALAAAAKALAVVLPRPAAGK